MLFRPEKCASMRGRLPGLRVLDSAVGAFGDCVRLRRLSDFHYRTLDNGAKQKNAAPHFAAIRPFEYDLATAAACSTSLLARRRRLHATEAVTMLQGSAGW